MLFFTSDLHFGSEEAIETNDRPFKNAKSFMQKTIKNWNKLAKKADIIYVIGDFIDCHEKNLMCLKFLSVVKKIKAKIILIIGNNEERIIKWFFNNDFEKFRNHCLKLGYLDVKKNDVVNVAKTTFFLTHKPKDHSTEMLNLFGHSHKSMGLYKSFGFNIGCDLFNYNLYGEKDIKTLLQRKSLWWDKDENLKLV